MRRLPNLPFRPHSRPIVPPISLSLPQSRHVSGTSPSRADNKQGWSKPKKKSEEKASSNPYLQGMNFDSSERRVALARGMLFSQRPMRGLALNPQDQIRHETIHRAWLLFQGQRRREKMRRLRLLESSISNAIKALKETDDRLYIAAVTGAREEEKRFPLVMRIPTNTLPKKWWNYSWSGRHIKGAGGVAKPG
jgi:large subunit ribosomal protein L40